MSEFADNPCPFLRAAVTEGMISNDAEPLGRVSAITVDAYTALPAIKRPGLRGAVFLIGLVGNGFAPRELLRNGRAGLRSRTLRDGPLDKHGVGSRIIDAQGRVNHAELDRLDLFAVDCVEAETGTVERGLGAEQITRMMDANFARAAGRRRWFDRRLMEIEWPVLLEMLGKPGRDGSYLSVAEIRDLIIERRLPKRVVRRMTRR